MSCFKIIPKCSIIDLAISKLPAVEFNVDDSVCFFEDVYTIQLCFYSKNLKCTWIWQNNTWVISNLYSNPVYCEHFDKMIAETTIDTSQKKSEKSVSNNKSINVLDLISQFTNEEFATLPLDVRLSLVTSLVRSDDKNKS